MSGYAANGNDFDNIFEPRDAGDPAMADVGYADGSVDLSDIYAPASVGDPGPVVGYQDAGVDIGPLFAAKGIRKESIQLDAEVWSTADGSISGFNSNTAHGSVNPTSVYGDTIRILQTRDLQSGTDELVSLEIQIANTVAPQDYFHSVITDIGTFETSNATFSYQGTNFATWQWHDIGVYFSAGIQTVTFVRHT